MRTIVMLLIASLVLTPTLAHATGGSGGEYGLLGVVALPVLVILLLVELEKKYPNWRRRDTASAAESAVRIAALDRPGPGEWPLSRCQRIN